MKSRESGHRVHRTAWRSWDEINPFETNEAGNLSSGKTTCMKNFQTYATKSPTGTDSSPTSNAWSRTTHDPARRA